MTRRYLTQQVHKAKSLELARELDYLHNLGVIVAGEIQRGREIHVALATRFAEALIQVKETFESTVRIDAPDDEGTSHRVE